MGLKRHCEVCDAVAPATEAGVRGRWIIASATDDSVLDAYARSIIFSNSHADRIAGSYCGIGCLAARAIKIDPQGVQDAIRQALETQP